jgi:hypothetical protein
MFHDTNLKKYLLFDKDDPKLFQDLGKVQRKIEKNIG